MRDLPGSRHVRQLLLAGLAVSVVAPAWILPAAAQARHHKPSAAEQRRAKQLRKAREQARLILNSSFIQRAQATATIVPFTVRLRRLYEGGLGDDVLQLTWDTASQAWPLNGTQPAPQPSSINLDGALTYDWDFGADVSGYAGFGTVETVAGRAVSMTATGFPIAVADPASDTDGCLNWQSLDATGVSFRSGGIRFGIVNPFTNEVSGTINFRTTIRSRPVACGGTPTTPETALYKTPDGTPPLPVAFNGKFSISPGITSDGFIRLGILRIDAATMPQRTNFGLVNACTDPAAADCAPMAFPVRTKLLSLTADVLAGDHMPPPAADPPEPAP